MSEVVERPVDWVDHLSDSVLFAGADPADLARVVDLVGAEQHFEAGTILLREGEIADRCLLVVDGEADVTVSGRYVASIGAGDAVGELALVDGLPRVATVTARTPVRAMPLEAEAFDSLLAQAPSFCRGLLRQVSRRLRETTAPVLAAPPAPSEPTTPSEPAASTTGSPTGDEAPAGPTYLDPFEAGFWIDPHSQYSRIREQGVVKHPLVDAWMIARFDDVAQVLRTPDLASVRIDLGGPSLLPEMERERLARTDGMGSRALLMVDPPEHTRLRRLVQPSFSPKAIRRAEHLTQVLVDDAIDQAIQRGSLELVADLAFPIPFQMISMLLGIPTSLDSDVREHATEVPAMFDPFASPEAQAAADRSARWMVELIGGVIEERRREPDDSLLSELIAAEDGGERLSHDELVELVVVLYIAGHETTVHLIGNTMYHLLSHPDQWDFLVRDPSIVPNAIEETIRFDSNPVIRRRLADDVEVGGVRIEAGDIALLCIAAANRDPSFWGPTAGRFDIFRDGAHRHLGFGAGVHHCLGSSLARLEARVAVQTIARRLPRLALVDDVPRWRETMVVRGLERLDLAF